MYISPLVEIFTLTLTGEFIAMAAGEDASTVENCYTPQPCAGHMDHGALPV